MTTPPEPERSNLDWVTSLRADSEAAWAAIRQQVHRSLVAYLRRNRPAGIDQGEVDAFAEDAVHDTLSVAQISHPSEAAARPGWPRHGLGPRPPADLNQAALTSIIFGVATCGAGTRTSSMPFAYFASTWATSTPSGSSKVRWNAPYASSRRK